MDSSKGTELEHECVSTRQAGGEMSDQEVLLTPSEVAALFRVDPKTVTRWAKAGKLTSIKTLGGHRRYKESEVKALLNSLPGNTASE